MRPVSIVVEGFFAYREKVTLDLAGVEYFSIAGPTGAGKSSLIDAMVFALYGRVPRLGGRVVAPVITAGQDRARISFEFEVEGRSYLATRLVQRTANGGASVREARLQEGDEILASGAAEVTRAVTDLLRLTFEDFTRTVVLPQGEFARFLQAPPSERQQLLRGLLGLDIYGQVRVLAQQREATSKSKAASLQSRIAELKLPTDADIEAARARSQLIATMSSEVTESEKSLNELTEARKSADAELEKILESKQRLLDIQAPPRLDKLDQLIGDASEELERLSATSAEVDEALAAVGEEIEGLPDMATLDRTERLYQRLDGVDAEIAEFDLETSESNLAAAELSVAEAQRTVESLRSELDEARVVHAAHEISVGLEIGDECPVCRSKVTEKPDVVAPDLAKEIEALTSAESRLESCRSDVAAAANRLSEAKATITQLDKVRTGLLADLEGAPGRNDLPNLRSSVVAAIDRKKKLAQERETLNGQVRVTQRTLEDLAEEQRSLRNLLMAARERVAELQPDAATSDDPIVLWKEFMAWREGKQEWLTQKIADSKEKVEDIDRVLAETRAELTQKLSDLAIPVEWPVSVAVARAHEQSLHKLSSMEQAVESNTSLTRDLETTQAEAAVAGSLAGHLRADGFERWLMMGAMSDLVSRANNLLAELSEDGYSLQPDSDGSFDIVDHRNADELRPISTLSGGETFMVSLALALSLAETLSAGGAGRLDAIILDEGFGTLDTESLDIVSAVLEGLTARGLMVGIITHVKDLAARAPVRFTVSKGLDGSKVELVS